MGFLCSRTREDVPPAIDAQMRIQEILSNVTLQEYEIKIKKLAFDGVLTSRQLSEICSYHEMRTRDNKLLFDILTNPFFEVKKSE